MQTATATIAAATAKPTSTEVPVDIPVEPTQPVHRVICFLDTCQYLFMVLILLPTLNSFPMREGSSGGILVNHAFKTGQQAIQIVCF